MLKRTLVYLVVLFAILVTFSVLGVVLYDVKSVKQYLHKIEHKITREIANKNAIFEFWLYIFSKNTIAYTLSILPLAGIVAATTIVGLTGLFLGYQIKLFSTRIGVDPLLVLFASYLTPHLYLEILAMAVAMSISTELTSYILLRKKINVKLNVRQIVRWYVIGLVILAIAAIIEVIISPLVFLKVITSMS